MILFRSLCVLTDSNGSLWILICSYPSLLVLMCPYKSLCVFMDSNVCLWDLIGPYSS